MDRPIISVESREQYHQSGNPDQFHLGHFRVVQYDFPKQHNQVIYEEFYSDASKSRNMFPIYSDKFRKPRLVTRVPLGVLSGVSYSLALESAKRLSRRTGYAIEDTVAEVTLPSQRAKRTKR